MKIETYPISFLARQPRPASYLDEMRAIALRHDGHVLEVDVESPGFLLLVEKYRNAPPPVAMNSNDRRVASDEKAHSALSTQHSALQRRPKPTLKQAASFAKAVVSGKYVRQSLVVLREGICTVCEHHQEDEKGMWCGRCGCGISRDQKRLKNLAAYEEVLNGVTWPPPNGGNGCKHPQRGEAGKGWPIDCRHWSASGSAGYGLCAIGQQGGRPPIGFCTKCDQREAT